MPDSPLDKNTKIWSQNVDISGGAIDGTNIGATTPGTGAFTTLAATGAVTFSNVVIKFTNVTSVDPSVAGQLYQNSTGQVFISAG